MSKFDWVIDLKKEMYEINRIVSQYRSLPIPVSAVDYNTAQALCAKVDRLNLIMPNVSSYCDPVPEKKLSWWARIKLWFRKPIFCSIIIPSRDRSHLLSICVASIYDKAEHPETIETILMCDSDDPETAITIDALQLHPVYKKYPIRKVVRDRSALLLRDYQNFGAKMSKGEMVWGFNDDAEILTDKWDTILKGYCKTHLSLWPDKIAYFHMYDKGSGNPDGNCCFPLFHRNTINVMGGTSIDEMANWGSDLALWDIYHNLVEDRIIRCPDIEVGHNSYHTGTVERDQLSRDMEIMKNQSTYNSTVRQGYIDRLNAAILRSFEIE